MPKTTPTQQERDAARNISAPEGETPRYSSNATLTYLHPEGWFVVLVNETTPHGTDYAAALEHWERVAR